MEIMGVENYQNNLLNSILTTQKGSLHKPECKICQDLGIVYYHQTARSVHQENGAWGLCDCKKKLCKCGAKPPYMIYDQAKNMMVNCPARPFRSKMVKANKLEKMSDIPARYKGKFLNSIEADPEFTDLMIAMEESMDMIARIQSPDSTKGLYLHGQTGCGKTLLSCAILNEILGIYTIPVKYAKINRDILKKLQASFNPNSGIYGEGSKIEDELGKIPALVIDDFGVHRDSEWVNQVLYDLIDTRYENDLLTIFTSNDPMSSWKDISSGRVLSRLKEMCRELKINMPDYRQKVHNKIQEKNLGAWNPVY